MHWPLVLHLAATSPRTSAIRSSRPGRSPGTGTRCCTSRSHFFQANQFWPLHDTLAFSDALVGYAPAGLIGSGPHAAVAPLRPALPVRLRARLRRRLPAARELGLGPGGAAVAGAAFAFAPLRLEQDGHLHVISSGGIPLALALGVRGYRLGRPGSVLAGLAASRRGSCRSASRSGCRSPTCSLALGAIAAVDLVAPRAAAAAAAALVVATLAGLLVFGGTALVARGPTSACRRPPRRSPHARDVESFSGRPEVFLVAPGREHRLGRRPRRASATISRSVPEKTLFPGLRH